MKVKDLIEWLKKQNPEDYVGIYDIGEDTGDLISLEDVGESDYLHPNFKISKKPLEKEPYVNVKKLLEK